MSKFKHTPGPWHISGGAIFIITPDEDGDPQQEHIADAGERDVDIIAAAPEMLDALIELYDRCENKNAYPDIKAIIERATGMTIDEAIEAYEAEHGAN